MLTGDPPWKNLEPMAAIFHIATRPPEYQLPAGISIEFTQLIAVLFTWDPKERPNADQTMKNELFN